MEYTLYLVLVVSSVLATLLSYVIRDVIALRLFSAFLLLAVMAATGPSNLWVGFGDNNVITYTGSEPTDPGRLMEYEVFQWGFGFWGVLQIFFAFISIIKLAFGGGASAENSIDKPEEYM